MLLTGYSSINAAEMPFTVNTVIPDNQIDKSKTFFNLKVVPNQQQRITVKLNNTTSKEITVNVGVNSTKTNSNGVVEYGKTTIKNDKSLKYPITELVKHPSSVRIPANSTTEVPFDVTMPKEKYSGIILGGIVFQQKESEAENSASSKGTSVQNHYAYAVALSLKETDDRVAPNLNLLTVKPAQNNARNVINVGIQNDQSILLSKVKVDAKIYAKGGKSPVYSSLTNEMQMAPNSNFLYPVALKGTEMKPGSYTLKLAVTGTAYDKPKTWHFTRNFKIKSTEAKTLNQSDVDLKANTNNNNWIYIFIGVLLFLVIILLIVVLIRQNKKSKS
ncbi:DUF916 and DUF3324 domain-containing protein [Leuconostoc sp. C2]|uniref:DUF916 and DUF3324 domain-containing protein n=1 Tax=Leuconostoc sp. (strain C2) TaxID=979982 RepID=UPI001FA7341D|nr:DUF916 and DUF3324 domain-containing protein [Leuconostoc sp. C2]